MYNHHRGNYFMKTMRLPLIIALGVAILGIILGSFFDLNLSTAIANPNNNFALTVSAIGPTIGFGAVAAMGGGFIAFILKGKYHIGLKILFGVLAAACYGCAVYYAGQEYFGINGFYNEKLEWLGYISVLIPEAAAMFGGYHLFKNYKNNTLWIVFCVIVGVLLLGLLLVIPVIKDNMHRPRYRLISVMEEVRFHNWWEPCKEYNYLKDTYNIAKDNFKSFPSGHTAEASIPLVIITFLPLADGQFKKWQLPSFLGGCALVLLVAFARILAGAHFLSDVSMGATITLALTTIANEVVMHFKAIQLREEE